ncbi:hypothetical protein LCGC14_1185680 [marine sediment metagenome]|uniref:Uncharacterized protein n=1 Tax=marine sediment metagenome TaxID=412755 RepID=A0A0F9P3Q3_9ZZZZ
MKTVLELLKTKTLRQVHVAHALGRISTRERRQFEKFWHWNPANFSEVNVLIRDLFFEAHGVKAYRYRIGRVLTTLDRLNAVERAGKDVLFDF